MSQCGLQRANTGVVGCLVPVTRQVKASSAAVEAALLCPAPAASVCPSPPHVCFGFQGRGRGELGVHVPSLGGFWGVEMGWSLCVHALHVEYPHHPNIP